MTVEAQHMNVYLNMISQIANIAFREIALAPEGADDDEESAPSQLLPMFGTAVHAPPSTLVAEDVDKHTLCALPRKSHSLLHTEDIVWHLFKKQHERMDPDALPHTFSQLLFSKIPPTVTTLSQILQMLSRADETHSFHALIYHIATVVAFQHYIRLVVLKTGQFAPQRTMNIQASYSRTLIEGLCQAALEDNQRDYIAKFDYACLE